MLSVFGAAKLLFLFISIKPAEKLITDQITEWHKLILLQFLGDIEGATFSNAEEYI